MSFSLRSQDGYNAQNVAIHTYGFVLIGLRPRHDGVRCVFEEFSLSWMPVLLLLSLFSSLFSSQDCGQYHQAKDGDGWVEYKGSLVFNVPQKGCLNSNNHG